MKKLSVNSACISIYRAIEEWAGVLLQPKRQSSAVAVIIKKTTIRSEMK
jgi:hypothetical protein